MNPIVLSRQTYWYLQARVRPNERGSSLVEYVLLIMLIAMVCLLAVTYLGNSTSNRFSNVASQVIAA